jgi:hypothetical protein
MMPRKNYNTKIVVPNRITNNFPNITVVGKLYLFIADKIVKIANKELNFKFVFL